jgi:hypothetical protein
MVCHREDDVILVKENSYTPFLYAGVNRLSRESVSGSPSAEISRRVLHFH